MRICIVGTGYVGLVTGAGFSETGATVSCADVDASKIKRLSAGEIPFFEPGLSELVARNVAGKRLSFTDDVAGAVAAADVVFIAVGTPSRTDGAADLAAVDGVAETIARHATREVVVVLKSTVPVGTHARVRRILAAAKHPTHVVSNPEFLKEGDAVNDFLRPDRIVVGIDDGDDFARQVMSRIYHPVCLDRERIVWMDPASAELTKYVANTMLAMRISMMNEVAALCDKVGADVHKVRIGVGSDSRIGGQFLYAGPGYGGSCLDGDESVLVRQGGSTRLITLGELYAELAGSTVGGEDEEDERPIEAQAIAPRDLEVLAWGSNGSAFHAVSAVTRRPFEGEAIRIRTKMGRRVVCTPDHPFIARLPGDEADRVLSAESLTAEHWLPVALGVPADAPRERAVSLDLLEWLPMTGIPSREVIVRAGPSARAALEALGLEGLNDALAPLGHARGRERARDILRTQALRLHEAQHLDLDLAGATFGTARNGTYIPREIPLDTSFFRVAGLYLSEGHRSVDGQRHRLYWSFHPSREQELVDEVVGYFERLGIRCDARLGTTTMQVSVSSRLLAALWTQVLRLGADCYGHRLPDLLWTQGETEKRALLAGIWLGDGSWSYCNGGPSVVLQYATVCRPLADGVLRLLGELGIVARLTVRRVLKSTCDTYWLTVSGAAQVERLLDLVHPRDAELIRDSIAKQERRIDPTGYRRMSDRMAWARIVSTERVPFRGFVYSMEVPGPETIVTTGGLVTHNCFPKDIKALVHTAREHGIELELAATTDRVNERQKGLALRKLRARLDGDLRGKKVAVWGIAFKPRTDDVREAPALTLIEGLLSEGARVAAHDPEAAAAARRIFGDRVEVVDDAYDAARGAHALVLVTEWRMYQNPDFTRLKELMASPPILLDARNIWSSYRLPQQGFVYEGIGVRTGR